MGKLSGIMENPGKTTFLAARERFLGPPRKLPWPTKETSLGLKETSLAPKETSLGTKETSLDPKEASLTLQGGQKPYKTLGKSTFWVLKEIWGHDGSPVDPL